MTKTITSAVAEKLSNISPTVNEKVIDFMVNKEIEKRSDAIVKGIEKLNGLQNDMKKHKPDQIFFDEEGNQTRAEWTKPKLEEKNKLTAQIDKMQKALDSAIGTGDMSKLYDLLKNASQ